MSADFISLIVGPSTNGESLLHQIDSRLLIVLNGPPGLLVAGVPGQIAYDQVAKRYYEAKQTVAGVTAWVDFPERASAGDVATGTAATSFLNAVTAKLLLDQKQTGAMNYARNGRALSASRGTSFVVGAPKYTLNGWSALRASAQSGFSVSKVGNAMRVARATGDANTGAVILEQPISTDIVQADLAGKDVTFGLKGTLSSGCTLVGNKVTLSLVAGVNATTYLDSINPYAGRVVVAAVDAVMSTTPGTYMVTGAVPANATHLSLQMSFTVAATGTVSDYADLTDIRLNLGAGILAPIVGNDWWTSQQNEAVFYQKSFPESVIPASGVGIDGAVGGLATADGKFNLYIRNTVPMRNAAYNVDFYNPYVAGSTARNETTGLDVTVTFSNRAAYGFYAVVATNAANANSLIKFHYALDNELY